MKQVLANDILTSLHVQCFIPSSVYRKKLQRKQQKLKGNILWVFKYNSVFVML